MTISKNQIIFLDTNILSDIARFDDKKIREIVFHISVDLKSLVAVTPFNILEIENIPDKNVKQRVHNFLNMVNAIYLKGMDIILDEEISTYQNGIKVNPMMFITTLVSKDKNGKPFNYLSVLNNLLSNKEYLSALNEHEELLLRLQNKYQNKLPVTSDEFIRILFNEKIQNRYSYLCNRNIDEIAKYCPSFLAYAYSLYDKIGSKGLKRKSGEMNDTAMSYIFPYVGVVVTEKRQANLFSRIKESNKIPALDDTIFLKYSDVFIENDFKIKEAIEAKQ